MPSLVCWRLALQMLCFARLSFVRLSFRLPYVTFRWQCLCLPPSAAGLSFKYLPGAVRGDRHML